jgi:hypothetical protein
MAKDQMLLYEVHTERLELHCLTSACAADMKHRCESRGLTPCNASEWARGGLGAHAGQTAGQGTPGEGKGERPPRRCSAGPCQDCLFLLRLSMCSGARRSVLVPAAPFSALLRHYSARTHWCSLPSAHKCRQGPARPCAKDALLHTTNTPSRCNGELSHLPGGDS